MGVKLLIVMVIYSLMVNFPQLECVKFILIFGNFFYQSPTFKKQVDVIIKKLRKTKVDVKGIKTK